mgnify:CR=1 FL=1
MPIDDEVVVGPLKLVFQFFHSLPGLPPGFSLSPFLADLTAGKPVEVIDPWMAFEDRVGEGFSDGVDPGCGEEATEGLNRW